MAAGIASGFGLRRPVMLLESDEAAAPHTWGAARPRIVLPDGAASWPDERLLIVLRHELAHVARGDWLAQMLAEAVRAAYWFNPVYWIACRRLRAESERACDDEVLAAGVKATDYAVHLLEMARNAASCPPQAVIAMARSSSLEGRVSAMLNTTISRHPLRTLARIATLLAFAAVTVPLAVAQARFSSLSGTVVDQVSRPVPGAVLVVANESARTKYEVTTDESGRFEFVALPAGDYDLAMRSLGPVGGRSGFRRGHTLARTGLHADASVRRVCSTILAEEYTSQFQPHVPASGPVVRDRYVTAAGVEMLPGRLSQRVHEGCAHLLSVEEARVGKNLVQVSPVSGALLLDEVPPADLVQLREVRLVLRVDDSNGAALLHDDVRKKVAEGAVDRVGPLERHGRLAKAAYLDVAARLRSLTPDDALDVVLPKPIERKLPGKAVKLAAAAEAALLDDPADGLEAALKHDVQHRDAAKRNVEQLWPRHFRGDVLDRVEESHCEHGKFHSYAVRAADANEVAVQALQCPPYGAAEARVGVQLGKAAGEMVPPASDERFAGVAVPEDPSARVRDDGLRLAIATAKRPQ